MVKSNKISIQAKDYNEKLRQNPSDENLWLEFVDYQDVAMLNMKFEDDKSSKKTVTSSKGNIKMISEKKLSILDTALQKNPDSINLSMKKLQVVFLIHFL
jgi:hypothetical protein